MGSMKMISFDVGIRNMAYCLFYIEPLENGWKVLDWSVLNLMEKEEPNFFCNCCLQSKMVRTKSKKGKKGKIVEPLNTEEPEKNVLDEEKNAILKCGKLAKYKKGENLYCEKHAKVQSDYIMPTSKNSAQHLKKAKIDILNEYAVGHGIQGSPFRYKKDVLDKLVEYYNTFCLEPIIKKLGKTAGETELVLIGRNMKELLNTIPDITSITHVIIENQISPIANRMKTVQGMLAQYFIMVGNTDIKIEFVSSSNKLKQFEGSQHKIKKVDTPNIISKVENFFIKGENMKLESTKTMDKSVMDKSVMDKSVYKAHKKDGIFYTKAIIEKNPVLSTWKPIIENSKKADDLADCFLQGLWYLNSKKLICYAEDLKINSV